MNRRNAEGYHDPTATTAIENAERQQERLSTCVKVIKSVAWACGFEVAERITLKDKESGRIFR